MLIAVDRRLGHPDPWRLLRLLLVLIIVVGLAGLFAIEAPWGLDGLPEVAFLPLLLAVGSALAGLISAAIVRSFRGPGASLCFAFALAAATTALWLPAIHAWSPSRWLVRALVLESLFGHWVTITVSVALLLFILLRRLGRQPPDSRAAFGIELFPLLLWAFESTSNLFRLFSSHYYRQSELLWWYAEGTIAEMAALLLVILFVASIARARAVKSWPRGLAAALLAVATALLDRAFALVLMLPESPLGAGGG